MVSYTFHQQSSAPRYLPQLDVGSPEKMAIKSRMAKIDTNVITNKFFPLNSGKMSSKNSQTRHIAPKTKMHVSGSTPNKAIQVKIFRPVNPVKKKQGIEMAKGYSTKLSMFKFLFIA
jgi:hypothetical protein